MNICEQAEAFRLLSLMGAVSVAEIVSWADNLIETHDQIPEWLLDVSLALNESIEEMASRLRDLPCAGNRLAAAYFAVERFESDFRSGKISPLSAAHMLQTWAISAKVTQDDWTSAMSPMWISDEICEGYASEDEVVSSIYEFLEHIAAARRAL